MVGRSRLEVIGSGLMLCWFWLHCVLILDASDVFSRLTRFHWIFPTCRFSAAEKRHRPTHPLILWESGTHIIYCMQKCYEELQKF